MANRVGAFVSTCGHRVTIPNLNDCESIGGRNTVLVKTTVAWCTVELPSSFRYYWQQARH